MDFVAKIALMLILAAVIINYMRGGNERVKKWAKTILIGKKKPVDKLQSPTQITQGLAETFKFQNGYAPTVQTPMIRA